MKNNEIHKTVQSDFLKNVSEILLQARKNAKTAVNLSMVYAYYEIGRMIVEEEQHGANRAAYGKQLLKELSAYLTDIFGKGFSTTNLKQMRQFYLTYVNDQISQTLSDQFETLPTASTGRKFFLSWSHYLKLMRIKGEAHLTPDECKTSAQFQKKLLQMINNSAFQFTFRVFRKLFQPKKFKHIRIFHCIFRRLYLLSFHCQPINLVLICTESNSLIKSTIILAFQLTEAPIIFNALDFIKMPFVYIIDEEHFLVDLVFYNRLLRCFVLFDLKIGELKHQDIGQMQMYVNYYDRKVKLPDENKTIGIVLCRDKNNAVVEMTLPEDNSQIFASKYETVLPKKEDLKKILEEQIAAEDGGEDNETSI